MLDVLRLPFLFDPARLQCDLNSIRASEWVPHFNTREYEGDWSAIPLRSVDGKIGHIYPDPTAGTERFADTPLLALCPYIQDVIAAFQCPKRSLRLLRLGAGSRIREHRDYRLGFEDGEIRVHIPVITNPEVEFYLAGERIPMQEGESWYVNFNLPHRLYNGGPSDRVHLVIDCDVNDWFRSVLFAENFERFHSRVQNDPALQVQLRAAPDAGALVPLLIRIGEEQGYTFGSHEVETALSRARADWVAGLLA